MIDDVATLEGVRAGALAALNLVASETGCTPLRGLIIGRRADEGECSIQRGLRMLGINPKIQVSANVICGLSFSEAKLLRRAWRDELTDELVLPTRVMLPASLKRFVEQFDQYHFPDLVECPRVPELELLRSA